MTVGQISDGNLAWAVCFTDAYGNRYELNTCAKLAGPVTLTPTHFVDDAALNRVQTFSRQASCWRCGEREGGMH